MNVPTRPPWFRPSRAIIVLALAVVVLGLVWWRWSAKTHRQAQSASAAAPTYVGKERCAPCHTVEAAAWQNSHHALAMQKATDSSVLGDFKDAHFTKDGVTSTFYKKDGGFFVRTDGPDGRLQDYELPYTFGVFPLQQYLVPFPGARLQSLVLAWDSRAKDQGGQRWFHLYPDQKMPYTNPLHWTGRNQTWNYMCAPCHSTNLRANYDLAQDSYATTWSEIDVSCESCHGPGSRHVKWAQSHKQGGYRNDEGDDGLVVDLKSGQGSWSQGDSDTLHWQGETRSRNEVETCAPCHARRRPITSDYQPGEPFLDAYVPNLLEEGVYFADGQVQEEDYEYGSFIQTKMYRAGVTCSDCHDPHSGKQKQASLNGTCGQCHSLAKFDTAQHYHHKPGTPEALCVNCHMATRTYMVVDARRDHSFRVPRPDLSVTYGTPNACNQCHRDKSAKWAAKAAAQWYGPSRRQEPGFVEAIEAGRRGLPSAERALTTLIADPAGPGIARATALTLLPQYLTPAAIPAVQAALGDSDALVRSAALSALEPLAPQGRVRLAAPLLTDSIRAVRIQAALLLAGTSPDLLQEGQKADLGHAVSELIASEMASAERPENHLDLALLYAQMGQAADAENELKTALRIDPNFVPAMVNLADLYRTEQRDNEAQQLLEKAIAVAPNAAEPIYALGLLKVRQKQYAEAVRLLARAAALLPDNVRYSYVYAVALHSTGQAEQAITILKQAHARRPADREVLTGLITFERDRGNTASAITYAQQLVQLVPDDPNAKTLLADLRGKGH
ncbi:MAG TPA: tetratricopeptide repeat protein [Terriglobia bacterium]